MQFSSWVKTTFILAIKTFAQTLAGLLGAGQADIIHASWSADLSIAGFAAIACVLHNVNNLGGAAATGQVALVSPVDIPNPRENAAEVIPDPAPAAASAPAAAQ